MSLPSLPLHKFQLSLSTPPPPPHPSLSFKQETMEFQKPEQVEAIHPRVKKLFSGDNLGWTLISRWTLINFWQNFQGGRLFYGRRLLILITNSRVDAYSNVVAY